MNESKPINIKYGETVSKRFVVSGKIFMPDDRALFVIRERGGKSLYWSAHELTPAPDNKFTFDVFIEHTKSSVELPVGNHEWGVSFYAGAEMNDDGLPIDGVVKIPYSFNPFNVLRAVSREECL